MMPTGFKRDSSGMIREAHAFFEAMKSVVPKHDRPDWQRFSFREYCEQFDQYLAEHTDIKASVMSIAGLVVAEGVFIKPAGDYDRAKEAGDRIEQFNKRVRMRKLIYETAIRMSLYGTGFWEKDVNAVHGINVQLIPHQKYMAPRWSNTTGELTHWDYRIHSVPKLQWRVDQICLFAMPPVEQHAPFGTSLLTGVDAELDVKTNILKAMEAYMEKQAWASNVLQIGDGQFMPSSDEVSEIENKVRNREVGEDFVTSYPTNLQVMGAAAIETRMIPDALAFVQERIQDAMLIPTMSKLYNSTEASAKVMTDFFHAVVVRPMQSVIAQVIEEQVYQPYLEDLGYSVRVVPELAFEPPDKWIQEMAEGLNLAELVNQKVLSRKAAAELLGLGEEYERDNMDQWDEWERQQATLQQQMGQQQDEGEFEEWMVRKRKR